MWGQCNEVMGVEVKNHVNYTQADADKNIIALLDIIDTVCLGGEFGNSHDKICWMITQYRKLLNFLQI